MSNIKILEDILKDNSKNYNEANTRHKIIDTVLHEILAWPKNRVSLEDHTSNGYIDYTLRKSNGDPIIIIEAKKEGISFNLPQNLSNKQNNFYSSIKKISSDKVIKEVIDQAKNYCLSEGCEFGAITNGHEWIFFKIFEKGKKWEDINCLCISDTYYFINQHTDSINKLSYKSITENYSLNQFLSSSSPKDRNTFSPKNTIAQYSKPMNANRLAMTLRPLATKYLGVISKDDKKFMEECYVSLNEYQSTSDSMRDQILDLSTPYFQDYGVIDINPNNEESNKLVSKLILSSHNKDNSQVLILFGGKGAGKSTFIQRLLFHKPPEWLESKTHRIVIDLLKVPESKEEISEYVWNELLNKLDLLKTLNEDRNKIIEEIFIEKYDVAIKQELYGLNTTSDAFNLKLNEFLKEWKSDFKYCCRKLSEKIKNNGKSIIVVVDNTDQYQSSIQDYCFSLAQQISEHLNCISIISMREERFHQSKIHGLLDAFQMNGFHISSPNPSDVFKKRLGYLSKQLDIAKEYYGGQENKNISDSIEYIRILTNELKKEQSHLKDFLTACAHGDIRLSLNLFQSFLLSGYTKVDEMISNRNWTFKSHQVIRPVMVPQRYFYDETLSDIPNIFQLRSPRLSSHFTSLRILRKLSKSINQASPNYFDILDLKSYFTEKFGMQEDFEKNIDMLLKHGFIESNNRVDYYDDSVDKIRITNYGLYMYKELAFEFTYIDLICTDCAYFDEGTSNFIAAATKEEHYFYTRGKILERLEQRVSRARKFIEYLISEEVQEKKTHHLEMPVGEMFTEKLIDNFERQLILINRSAKKLYS